MSAIAGVMYRNRRPAGEAEVRAMAGAIGSRASDELRLRVCGPFGLVWQAFHTTCESEAERQPIADEVSGETIVFDGRIDNRAELISRLDGDGLAHLGAGDATLALRASVRWREQAPAHLLGDFAFAVCHPASPRLFCARDPIGVRPLYYAITTDRVIWSTDHRALVASGLMAVEPNEGAIAEHLASELRTADETIYAGVLRLPAGHALMVDGDTVRRWCYWDAAEAPDVRYRDDREYADRFFELFADAVACRVRTNRRPVAAHLSGGLDSSSVVAMTQVLSRRQPMPPIETVSLVYPDHPDADEAHYIDAAVEHWHLVAHRVLPLAPDIATFRDRAAQHWDVIDAPADQAGVTARAAIRDLGARVVLTGVGGDHGFAGSMFHYVDLLRDRGLAAVWHQIRADRAISDVGWSPLNVVAHGVLPLLPRWFKDAVKPAARQLGWPGGPPSWIARSLATRVDLEARTRLPAAAPDQLSRLSVWDAYAGGYNQWALEMGDRMAADFAIEERHPFFDRRIVEFAVGIPEQQRWRGAETKFVMRRAMGDLLPQRVAARVNKADFTVLCADAIDVLASCGVYDNLQTAARGWVDGERVREMYRELKHRQAAGDDRFPDHVFPLWMIGGVELWLGAVFG